MSTAKPTLGYPTRTAAVLALRSEGLSTGAIARRIGIDVCTVSALECSARRSPRAPRAQEVGVGNIQIPVTLLQALAPHAARRRIKREQLAIELVAKVLEDRLVDAVMDDREQLQ